MTTYITEWVTVISTTAVFLQINTGSPVGEQSQLVYDLPTVGSWFKDYWYVLFVLILFLVICIIALVLSIVRWRRLVKLRKEGGIDREDALYTDPGTRNRRSDSTLLVRSLSRSNIGSESARKRGTATGEQDDDDEEESSSSSDSDDSDSDEANERRR